MTQTTRTEEKIEVVGTYKHIQVRTATITEDNGIEISRSYSRKVFAPGDDVSGESSEIQSKATEFHTSDLITTYQTHLSDQAPTVGE